MSDVTAPFQQPVEDVVDGCRSRGLTCRMFSTTTTTTVSPLHLLDLEIDKVGTTVFVHIPFLSLCNSQGYSKSECRMVLKENLYTMTLIKKIIKKINQRKIDCISVPKKKKLRICIYMYWVVRSNCPPI